MRPSAIAARDVRRSYRTPAGDVHAVAGIDIDVPDGQRLAIMGPSGCGKSTLLSLIGCLEPADSGTVTVLGTDLATLTPEQRAGWRRQNVGFMFQAYDLVPFLTATENVALMCGIAGRDPVRTPRDLLERLGLAGHQDKLPDQLSGGQKQRVGIARCLVHRPAIVLADEPTGGLDSMTSTAVIDLLLEATAEIGATTVVVSHDPSVAVRFDRTVALRDGRIVGDTASGATVAELSHA